MPRSLLAAASLVLGMTGCAGARLHVPPIARPQAVAADHRAPPRADVEREASVERETERSDHLPRIVLQTAEPQPWTFERGQPVPRTVMRGGQEVQIGEPDRVRQDWIDEFGYRDTYCPLVLSFDGRDPALSPAAADAASFELAGLHTCNGADWPDADTPWLAIDLDGNGSIDGGHELFGSGTRMPDGTFAADGFAALAVLDSDGDGRISSADAQWPALTAWRDHDRDREVDPGESTSLDDEGIAALELGFGHERRCDARGNCSDERATMHWGVAGQQRVGQVVDVHLRCR